ncbi:MAG: ATP-binding protein [Candidatus Woesearchaeota archaeon]
MRKDVIQPSLEWRLGKDLAETVTRLATSDLYAAIVEIIANSHDADAKLVDIEYSRKDNELSVSDEGNGMTPEMIQDFFTLGDSPKQENKISPGGRSCMGRFGVATSLLRNIAERFTLFTVREGIETSLDYTFGDSFRVGERIPYTAKDANPEIHGTKIIMRGLKFDEDQFDPTALKNRLQWDLPLHLPDFDVRYNRHVVQAKAIKNAVEFPVDKKGRYMGSVNGTFYLLSKATEMCGIHVYINNRRYGDPKAFLASADPKGSVAGRLIGILHADDLEDAILFNRRLLQEDHKGIGQLRSLIRENVRQVRNYTDRAREKQAVTQLAKQVPLAVTAIQTAVRGRASELNRSSQIRLPKKFQGEGIGSYDPDAKSITLNPDSPFLTLGERTKKETIRAGALISTLLTLARSRIGDQRVTPGEYESVLGDIWREVTGDPLVQQRDMRIFPQIAYTPQDLAEITRYSAGALRYMANGRVLSTHGDKITGKSYLDIEPSLTGLINLFDFLSAISLNNVETRMASSRKKLRQAGKSAEPFVLDFGTDGKNCYFVDEMCTGIVRKILDISSHYENYADPFIAYNEQMLSTPLIMQTLTGVTDDYVKRVLDFSRRDGLRIIQRTEKRVHHYKLGQFVTAAQAMRAMNS